MKNLKKLRTENHLSQQQLADLLYITQQSVWKYENGLAEPDIDTLKALAKIFHTGVDEIIGFTKESPSGELGPETDTGSDTLSVSERELISLYRKLDLKTKNALLDFLKGLI